MLLAMLLLYTVIMINNICVKVARCVFSMFCCGDLDGLLWCSPGCGVVFSMLRGGVPYCVVVSQCCVVVVSMFCCSVLDVLLLFSPCVFISCMFYMCCPCFPSCRRRCRLFLHVLVFLIGFPILFLTFSSQ